MSKKFLTDQIFKNSKGYLVIDIDLDLIKLVKKFVGESLYKNIFPEKVLDISSNYFDISLEFLKNNNSFTFTRYSRTIDKNRIIKNKKFILNKISQSILKPTHLVNNDLYYRVVRKDVFQEISVIHRDVYFHNIQDEWTPQKNVFDLKLWFPLYQEENKTLGVIPNSHLDKEFNDVTYEEKNGKKISFKCRHKIKDLTPVEVNLGQALVFPSTLIHGSLEKSFISNLRVSSEFTLGYAF